MQILSPVVEVAAGPVFDVGQQGMPCHPVAAQAIGDQALKLVLQALQQASEEAFGSSSIAFLLHQDVYHDPVLIHCTLEIAQHAVQPDKHLIKMPSVSWPRPAMA